MCSECPCRGTDVECLRWPAFCGTLAHGDEVQRRHVVERSRMGGTPAPAVHAADPIARLAPADAPSVAESLALLAAAKACPFASRDSGCGCQGVACGLRPRERRVVSLQDCMSCVRRYGP